MVKCKGGLYAVQNSQTRVNWSISHGHERISRNSETADGFATPSTAVKDQSADSAARAERALRLRSSNVELGWQNSKVADTPAFLTESKGSYTKHAYVQPSNDCAKQRQKLQASRIDLAHGSDKSGKHWGTDMREKMSSHSDEKYNCGTLPCNVGKATYVSQVPLDLWKEDGNHASVDTFKTTHQCQFVKPRSVEQAPNFQSTLGQSLRTTSFDLGNGMDRAGSDWHSVAHGELSRVAQAASYANASGLAGMDGASDMQSKHGLQKSTLCLGDEHVDYSTSARGKIMKSSSTPGLRSMRALGRLGMSITMSGTMY